LQEPKNLLAIASEQPFKSSFAKKSDKGSLSQTMSNKIYNSNMGHTTINLMEDAQKNPMTI